MKGFVLRRQFSVLTPRKDYLEVEKKFRWNATDTSFLGTAQLLKDERFTDVYWDTPHHVLTCNDCWLRQRGNRYELKVPLVHVNSTVVGVDVYREHHGFDAVIAALDTLKLTTRAGGFSSLTEMDVLHSYGLNAFLTIVTHRRSYITTFKGATLQVDLDNADGSYCIGEVEMIVANEGDVDQCKRLLCEYVDTNNLDTTKPLFGKVLQRIKDQGGNHYRRLVESGIVHRKTLS
jgi:adenylate cyclase class IV